MRIILSRTDSIGDVVLTLPMAGMLKQAFPGCTVIFLGSDYTRPVVKLCRHVDEFVTREPQITTSPPGKATLAENLAGLHADAIIHVFPVKEICLAAKRARIPVRVATSRRYFTWFTCNRLLNIPRKSSGLHESQLNLKLLKGLGIDRDFTLQEIAGMYGMAPGHPSSDSRGAGSGIFRLILHPTSKGSAREWGLENFSKLIGLLPREKFDIFITGTKEDGVLMAGFLEKHRDRVKDMTGKLSLPELIALIGSSDGLVAASTGPLHLAAALGIRAVGLYAPMRPIFPRRWAPLGKNAAFLVLDKKCSDCRKSKDCQCIRSIAPGSVVEKLTN